MRERLGFTVRPEYPEFGELVYLDFYNEQKLTMFLMQYGDLIVTTNLKGI